MAGRPDGGYTVGIRPHHVTPSASGSADVEISGTVQVTELSGSESVIHFSHEAQTWVSQSHGILDLEIGTSENFQIDLEQCMYFDSDGKRVGGET
jgi:glycerol transport system ATP-binding protein